MIQNQEFTYIGKATNLAGTFKFNGPTHLQGHLQGDIVVENFAKMILEIGSYTEGSLQCFDLDIYGEFVGVIQSLGRVTIYPTAYVEGKIISKTLEILPGAIVNMNGHTEE
ncbi:MAG: polymer-forming cytoskeletal protein [Bacteriovorax sp.]|nr:polymer-forming cytoskeletal protein [Bacteriovorax sp.]